MKTAWTLGFLIILTFSVSIADEVIDTLKFDLSDLNILHSARSVEFDADDFIRDADFPSVPYRQFYCVAENSGYESCFQGIVLLADTINIEFQPHTNIADQITSDREIRVDQLSILEKENSCYPGQVIEVSRRILKGRTVWSLLLFPIQYLDDGRIVFNRQIEVRVTGGDASFGISDHLPDGDFFINHEAQYLKVTSPSLENGCPLGNQYAIVTSAELAEAFESFLDLKLCTGFDAAIAVTDSIFSYYDGVDEAEALRNYLKDFYLAGGEYVLLGGDEDHVPVRYAYFYNTDTLPDLEQLMICDLYFADYDGDWDTDGDGVWGEPTADRPDQGAEVALGRLPFSEASQVMSYTEKLRRYLFDPGGGDRQYLARSAFITSDQMLDYFEDSGQQHYVAEKFPADLSIDCDRMAESPTGDAPIPTGPSHLETVGLLDEGYGFINILAHGRADGFILTSREYNQFPKSYLLTGPDHIGEGAFDDLNPTLKISFYYTISCSQGAFDLEALYAMSVPSVVEKLLDLDSSGAMGIVGFSRWGWVGSSYKLMASFYEHLFGDAEGYPVEAMYRTYLDYPYYTDQIYGQNYHGDPSLQVYLDTPAEIQLTAYLYYDPMETWSCRFTLGGQPYANQAVVVKIGAGQYQSVLTGGDGRIYLNLPDTCTEIIEVTAYKAGVVSVSAKVYPSIAADADDDDLSLPDKFELGQNYPNPFNPATTIRYTLTRHQHVSLRIYDILGRLIDQPIDGFLSAGEHKVEWNGSDRDGDEAPSGVYLYRLVSGEGMAVKKMMLVR
jgi:hypothetical protein